MTDSRPGSDLRPGRPNGDPLQRRVVSFARTDGRALTRHHHAAERDGRQFMLEVPRGETSTSIAPGQRLDQRAVFGRSAPLVVEIGSGVGDALVHGAREHPETDYLGVEVYRPGMARTLAGVLEAGLTNVRLVRGDGVEALEHLIDPGSLAELWTFFPDPWPKLRHHKRRLVDADFAMLAASRLRPDGVWRLATDWEPYAQMARDVIRACPALHNPYDVAGDGARVGAGGGIDREAGFAPRFEGRPTTKFERKGVAAGRAVHDLTAHAA